MSILSRLKEIMASNVNAFLDQAADPEQAVVELMKGLNRDLGQVKAETASVLAEERRASRALEDCRAELRKLDRYAEKSLEAGREEEARRFLERKAPMAEQEAKLQSAYETAASNAAGMRQAQDKLAGEIAQLEERRAKLTQKLAEAKAQNRRNAAGSPTGGQDALFDALEAKANQAYDEAMAIAELRRKPGDDLDELDRDKKN